MNRVHNDTSFEYELIDCGEGRRLERFADIIIDRPAPQANWQKKTGSKIWESADAYYERPVSGTGRWIKGSAFPENWLLRVDNLNLELHASKNGQIGIFPEHQINWRWMSERLRITEKPVRMMNIFAYTGAATLVAASAVNNIEVCHLDGSGSAVSWARRNAELSGLDKSPVRWIVDDVMKFLKREIKRNRRYDAFIIDPPAFGRGQGGLWKLERDLPVLIESLNRLLSDDPCFIILSCHSPAIKAEELAGLLDQLDKFRDKRAESLDLVIQSTKGNDLPSGICARINS